MEIGNNFKTAVFDLDGTLIDREKDFFDGVLEGLFMLKENGINLFLATGRNPQSIRDIISSDEFFESLDKMLICNDGNVLYNYDSGEWHIINYFLKKKVHAILDNYSKKASIVIESNGKIFSSSKEALLKYKFVYNTPRNTITITDIEEMKTLEKVTEIYIFSNSSTDLLEELLVDYSNLFWYSIDRFRGIKLIPNNSCKARGISKVLCTRGIDLKDVVAFGDAKNDISMLTNCGVGIAVKGCKKELLEKADITLEEDLGVFLQQWAKSLNNYIK
ncbi:HAD-IIB family hydrolase [Oceanobacillus sp. CFH 90083]|uniref:HAD-IIB family hydrolase n=1 Tax=Oceanobacillus sp. CFH 90083 TaxID=2592336 RepID=UPI00128D433E|nr:HAD-IIB family hydrolase [Oceanobacillus sp. CFH 90083]